MSSAVFEQSAAAAAASIEKPDSPAVADMDEPQLIEAVRKQVEYYFSKENLQSDAFLTSQMDANMSVAISVVMKFAKLKALTQDESILRRALEGSSLSIVDNRIKANIKSAGRSTIILREISSDAPVEEVKEIFNFDGCAQVVSIRSDVGDTWFVTMDTEEEAKQTIIDLRVKKRMFRGQPVKARLKTETVVRSFFPVQAAPPAVAQGGMNPYGPMPGMNPYGGMGAAVPSNGMGGIMGPMVAPMPGMGPAGAPIDLRAYNQYIAAMAAAGNGSIGPQGQGSGGQGMMANGQSAPAVDQNALLAAAQAAAAAHAAAAAAGMAVVLGPDGQLMQQPLNPQQHAQLMQRQFDPNMPIIPNMDGTEAIHSGPPSGKGGKNRKGNRGANHQAQQGGGHGSNQQQQQGAGGAQQSGHESGGKRRGKGGNAGAGADGGAAHGERGTGSGGAAGGGRKGGQNSSSTAAAASTSIEINTLNFPPLGGEGGDDAAIEKPLSPLPHPGYKSAVQKNTIEGVTGGPSVQATMKGADENSNSSAAATAPTTSATAAGAADGKSASCAADDSAEKEKSIVDMAIGATSVSASTVAPNPSAVKVSASTSTEHQQEEAAGGSAGAAEADTAAADAGGPKLNSSSADAVPSKASAGAPSSWAAMVRSAATTPPPTAAGDLASSLTGAAAGANNLRVVRSIGTNTAAGKGAVAPGAADRRTAAVNDSGRAANATAGAAASAGGAKDNKDGRRDRPDRRKPEQLGGRGSAGGPPGSPSRIQRGADSAQGASAPGGSRMMETEVVNNAGSEPLPALPAGAWGGKASFANIVKQSAFDEAMASNSSNISSNNNTAAGSSSGGSGTAATAPSTVPRSRIQPSSARPASSNNANAPGVWAKETLPEE